MRNLIIAPHADDEVLGVGGTIAKMVKCNNQVTVAVCTGHGSGEHPIWNASVWDSIRRECESACKILGVTELLFRELPAACLDHTPIWQINSVIQELIEEVKPDRMFIPFANDLHKDHGYLAYAVQVATRPYLDLGSGIKQIYAYETLTETHLAPPYLETAFQPNTYCDITDFLEKKLEAFSVYESQIQCDLKPRSIRGLTSLAHLRGCAIGVGAAEAFVLLRQTI